MQEHLDGDGRADHHDDATQHLGRDPFADKGPELAAELLAYCREHLASFKCPRSIDFDRALPRLDTGKLYKKELRARYWP